MRVNEPVTNTEIVLPEGTILVSRTDPAGRITYVNQAFVDVSGFSEEELIGAPHNLVRHPHMPAAAFADLWTTIKAGKPWEGIVKNRAKNGDHYWVRANATPEMTDGQITGYVSIRTVPSREQVAAAEALYAGFRNGTARNVMVVEGEAVSTTLGARAVRTGNSVTGRLAAIIAVMISFMVASVWVVLDGMGDSNDALREVYEASTLPAGQMAELVDRMQDSLLGARLLPDEVNDPQRLQSRIGAIRGHREKMAAILDAYAKSRLGPDEKRLADDLARHLGNFAGNGLDVAVALAEARDAEGLRRHGADALGALFAPAHAAARDLLALNLRLAGGKYEEAMDDYAHHSRLGFGLLVLGALMSGAMGYLLIRYVRQPLNRLQHHFGALSAGDFSYVIPPEPVNEFRPSNAQFRAMKAKLAFNALERQENAAKGEALLKNEMLKLTVLLENEIQTTVSEISTQAERLREGAGRLLETAGSLRSMAQAMNASIEVTTANVQTVAGATAQLEASSREITGRIRASSDHSEQARHKVDLASHSVGTLTEATARIGDVANLIRTIAGQTRMLALNATIEAARAGDAGKGFAVVAGEVKGLADQTEDAIGRVNAQAGTIEQTTREAVATVEAVAATIRDIESIAAQVADAAEEQRAATAEIMSSAVQAADHTRDVAGNATLVLSSAEQTGGTARKVSELSTLVSHDIGALQRRLNVILRTSYGGNRRAVERIPVSIEFTATFAGTTFSGHTGDISVMGALLVVGNAPKLEGEVGTVTFPGLPPLDAKAILGSHLGIQCQFPKVSRRDRAALERMVEDARARDLPYVERVQAVAAKVEAAFEKAVATGRISVADLFDADYTPIPDTDPMQVMAKHTTLTDEMLPDIIDGELERDPAVALCCATDRNGYIATHNRKCSQPQRPGEVVWNTANSRNRRIFDDRAGILSSRNTEPFLAQTYVRDMGGGNFMVLKEISCPVKVGERHWGAIRFALKL